MSSAILYLAIVAIWACVLIPRWLRRDPARGASVPAAAAPPGPGERGDSGERGDAEAGRAGDGPVTAVAADDVRRPAPEPAPAPAPALALARVAEPVSPEEARRRMLSARRRLLLMLAGLEIAAVVLAVLSLAAVWVVIPPSVMLFGYLLLLREAAQADAERARYESEAAERARARERVRIIQARPATRAEGTAAEGAATTASALAAKFAAAPVAGDYADSGPGRDFAPGLAGKYTTSNAEAEVADEDYYSGYEPPRLRAVGD